MTTLPQSWPFPSRVTEGASIDNLHGDEHVNFLTPQEEAAIERRVKELIADKLREYSGFREVLAGIEPEEIDTHLHRALNNLDAACQGEKIAITAILTALCHIQRRVYVEAVDQWTESLRRQA